jgi:formate dehydrogenase maturation protein FdhE
LVKPPIREQIIRVESAKEHFTEYGKILIFHKSMLEILLSLDESLKRGVKKALTNEYLNYLLEKTVSSKTPIGSYFNASDFDMGPILDATKGIIQLLIDEKGEGEELKLFAEELENNDAIMSEAIESILKEDSKWFQRQSERYSIESALLLLIFDSPLKPFFEEISRKVEETIKETWLEPYCPVCGRQSTVAINRKLKRYMICPYCGLEYLVDPFNCLNCGNNDPTSMGFISITGYEGYELNYCELCNHYIKILDEGLALKIPSGLEDLLTRDLDCIAKGSDLGLERA